MDTIMIVEDDKEIRSTMDSYLSAAGYRTVTCANGIEALSNFQSTNPDLIVLDVMMPGIDGFEVLKQVRLISAVPVIMLTARGAEVDRLKGFDLGVDDYVVKPFSHREIVKRAAAILRRTKGTSDEFSVISYGPFSLSVNSQEFKKNGESIPLTTLEYQIMLVFMKNPGTWLTREQLIEKAFGYDYEGSERNIDAYIKNIRQKIELDSKNPKYVTTKYGSGYRFGGDL